MRCSVVGEAGEVEVGKRPTWEKVTSQHLADGLQSEGFKSAQYLRGYIGSWSRFKLRTARPTAEGEYGIST